MIKLFRTLLLVIAPLVLLAGVLLYGYFNKKEPLLPVTASLAVHQQVELPTQQLRLFVIGDMGRQGEPQAAVAAAMERRCQQARPHAMVFLGDNIYPTGVESIDDPAWESKLMQYYRGDCIGGVPIYAVLGNHDYRGNAQAQVDYHQVDSRWHMPFRNYDVRFGKLLSLTVIDNWYMNYCFGLSDGCTIDFMKESLTANQDVSWRLVAGHYPARSASTQSSNHAGGAKGWLLEHFLCGNDLNTTAYLAGHAHHLEHSRARFCDMDIIISGAGGGSDLYSVAEGESLLEENKFVRSTNGFAEINADPDRISYTFFSSGGEQLYSGVRLK